MRCAECGAELQEGCIYCPVCGTPVQMVPDYTSLEDLLADEVSSVMDADRRRELEARREREQQAAINAARLRGEKREKELERQYIKRKKQRGRNIALIVIGILVAVVAVLMIYILSQKSGSYASQMKAAEDAYESGDYETSMGYYNKASELQTDEADPYVGIGNCYLMLENMEQAEAFYKKAIEVESDSMEAYEALIALYDGQGMTDKISSLLENCDSKKVRETFQDYLCETPVIKTEGGTYEEFITVEISVESGTVYYTLDGKDPDESSAVYDGGIELQENGKYIIRAVCINEKGIRSGFATAEYVIQVAAPAGPVVSPDSGTYNSDQKISVEIPEGCKVYYTLDGSTPTVDSTEYTTSVNMPEGRSVFSCIAVNEFGMESSVISRAYELIYLQ